MPSYKEMLEQVLVWVDDVEETLLTYPGEGDANTLSLVLPVATDAGLYIASDGDLFLIDLDTEIGHKFDGDDGYDVKHFVDLLREQALNASRSQVERYYKWSQAIVEL